MDSLKEADQLDIEEIIGSEGVISHSYSGFETRPEQIQMAKAVQKALVKKQHLAVEAGTGVGKSFAYLVPLIKQAHHSDFKVVVSTYTITLQEQLINKDIPFLADALPYQFTAVLAKGRGNYICLRRLNYVLSRQQMLFKGLDKNLSKILDWSIQTKDGSLSDLGFLPPAQVWDAVRSEHGNCRGRKCPRFHDCFYWRARRSLESADIIVANHALLFSDLVLKEQETGILPDYKYVVIDEAHNIEHVAEGSFGVNVTNNMVTFLLNGLYNPRTGKGVLAFSSAKNIIALVGQCLESAKVFFRQIQAWYEHAKEETNGRCQANFVDDNITESIRNLRLALDKLAKNIRDVDEQFEIIRYIDRCEALEQNLRRFLNQPDEDYVYWVETEKTRSAAITLRATPINVGPDVKKCLFDKFESVILTSATLSCDGTDEKTGFNFFSSRVGLEDYEALKLGSPFDYEKQVTMYIEADLPEPNQKEFQAEAIDVIKKYLRLTSGKAFVLFTSYSMLNSMADELSDWLAQNGISLLQQGTGTDRTTLLDTFKTDTSSVLFGTDSFWQGVDVPGEALSNVIIVRLPFAVPNHPLIQSRIEKIRQQGHNPFFQYQLPSAIIKFKQGFGRLIRSKTDRGIVVILDSRIIRKTYGKQFLSAVPKCDLKIITRQKNKLSKHLLPYISTPQS